MNVKKVLFYILVFAMLAGGAMGLIKNLIPDMPGLSFRSMLGLGTVKNMPQYAALYGAIMAVVEITAAILLLKKSRISFWFALAVLCVNTVGCGAAIILGDILATASVLTRILGVCILCVNRDETRKSA